MPQLVAAAVAYALPATAATAVTIGTTAVAYSTLIGYAAVIGGSVAYGSSQSAKLRRQLGTASLDQGRTVMVRDPVAARRLIYGQVLVSGTIVFIHTTGTKNEYLHLVIVLAGHEVEEIGDIYFNDELVALSGNVPTGKYAAVALINKKRGVAGDTADADLVAAAPTFWTSAHTLSGCAYLAVKLKWSADLFPNGMPTIKALVKGKKVYDPRSGLTAWSANSALCASDFLADSTWGRGVAQARIRSADLIEAANICDENIVKDDASTEDRYTTNGTILSSQDPGDVLNDLAGAMAGHIVDTGGTWTVRAGAYRSSTLTLTDDHFVGPFSMQPRQSRQDTFNRVRGLYISPDNQWAAADFPAIGNTTYKTKDGGIWLDRDVQYNFTTSSPTAQRLAKIALERGRQQITVTVPCNLIAMQLMPGDTVAITRARLGWTAKQFEVIEWKFRVGGEADGPTLSVDLSIRETASGVWDWANGEETTVDLAPNTDLPDPFTVPTPSLTLLTDNTTVNLQPDGTVSPRLKISWTTPNDIHVESGGFVEIEYKKSTDSDYVLWTAARGDSLFDYLTDVKVGLLYDIRARFRNNAGVRGSYASATSSAIVGDTGAPAAPAGATATAQPGFIDLFWAPSLTNTVYEYQILRSTTSGSTGFTFLANTSNNQYQDMNVTAGTVYWYLVYATTVSLVGSASGAAAGPATALIAPNGAVPSAPTAPAQPGTPVVGTYDAGDGSVYAFVTLNLSALPTNARWQNLLYRRTGSGDWLLASQFNTGSATLRIDDLSPGVGYDIAVQAFNGAGGSSIVSGTSFTAANKTSASANPTSFVALAPSSTNYIPQTFAPGTSGGLPLQLHGCSVSWTPSTDKDVLYIELGYDYVGSSTVTPPSNWRYRTPVGKNSEILYGVGLTSYLWARTINGTGVVGTAFYTGIDLLSYMAVPATFGTMSTQAASGVAVTGGTITGLTQLKVGTGSTGRTFTNIFATNDTVTLAGGAAVELVYYDITNRGFTAAVSAATVNVEDIGYTACYVQTNGTNSTTIMVLAFYRYDGANCGNVPLRFDVIAVQY